MNDTDREPQAIGWDAINDALAPIYGGQEPMHWGTVIPAMLGGKDPLQGISAYRRNQPQPHLHYITYGFSELYEKESEDPELSGWGFELTFRLACEHDDEPPGWILNFLQNLGRYVFNTGNVLGAGHSMPLNGPIALGVDTEIWAIGFVRDPELGLISTPNGQVEFLQVVGLTQDELQAIEAWNCRSFLELVKIQNELLITNLARPSYLADRAFADDVLQSTESEGVSAEALYCNHARVEKGGDGVVRLILGATVADGLRRRLKGRVPFGRPFSLFSNDTEIRLEPGPHFSWRKTNDGHVITLSAEQAKDVCDVLQPRAGIHTLASLPEMSIVIEQSQIKDGDGKVVNVVG